MILSAGLPFVVMGLIFLLFRRRLGLLGSKQRAWMRRRVPVPDDEAYVLIGGMLGCAFLLIGVAIVVVQLVSP